MIFRFSLEVYPSFALAWAVDWPGLTCGGSDRAEVEESVSRSISEFGAWLLEHDEQFPPFEGWAIEEIVDAAAAKDEFAFQSDREPLTAEDFERSLRHIALASRDLERAADLPSNLLDWLPPNMPLGHTDPWSPDPRTIRGILVHALQLEVYYRNGLRNGPSRGIFDKVRTPQAERRATLAALRALPEREWATVFHPVRPSRTTPDDWTVRKVLRRLISHHRAHTAEILQRRTWLLLGVPKP